MKPLCVDLDGALLKGDALWEQTLYLLRARPAAIFEMAGWLTRGKAYFKEQMAAQPLPPFPPSAFHEETVEWLRAEAAAGRRLHLVTAAHRGAAAAAAAHCGCFAAISSSTAGVNLSRENKAALLCEAYGPGQFDYAGNSADDLPAWRGSHVAIALRTRPPLLARLRREHPSTEARASLPPLVYSLWQAIRPQQLVKNLLLFLPLILAHQLGRPGGLGHAAIAFVAFSAAAAFGYCLNDLLDLAADRLDSRKARRPLAAGELSPAAGLVLAAGALAVAGAAAGALPWAFRGALAAYLVITPLYSFALKRQVGADVLVLTGLYVLRVLAGGLATGVAVSQWLLSFSLFFFLSLSLIKRYGELLAWEGRLQPADFLPGRGYQLRDRGMVRAFGTSSAYVSVLVFILYVNAPSTQILYPFPELLWCIGILLAFWLNRLWLLAGRGLIPGDPIPFIAQDRVSWGVAAAAAMLVLGAALLRHGS